MKPWLKASIFIIIVLLVVTIIIINTVDLNGPENITPAEIVLFSFFGSFMSAVLFTYIKKYAI